jgi:hypothetical protein
MPTCFILKVLHLQFKKYHAMNTSLRFVYHLKNISLQPCQWAISWSWPSFKEIMRLKTFLSGLFLFNICTIH